MPDEPLATGDAIKPQLTSIEHTILFQRPDTANRRSVVGCTHLAALGWSRIVGCSVAVTAQPGGWSRGRGTQQDRSVMSFGEMPTLATGRRGADVADPGLEVGAAETVEDGRDHRADRTQASVAGVTLLP